MRFGTSGAVLSVILFASTGLAMAQERLPFRGQSPDGGPQNSGVRFIKPGALLMASFDSNHDLIVTSEELQAGAAQAFSHADADANGALTPIEQRNWATRLMSEDDVLGNSTLFPASIPGQVNVEEFTAGLITFSERFADEDGVIHFQAFTFQPKKRDNRRKETNTDEIERLRRPTVQNQRPTG